MLPTPACRDPSIVDIVKCLEEPKVEALWNFSSNIPEDTEGYKNLLDNFGRSATASLQRTVTKMEMHVAALNLNETCPINAEQALQRDMLGSSCTHFQMPASSVGKKLKVLGAGGEDGGNKNFEIFRWSGLVIGLLLIFWVLCHDLCLLQPELRSKIAAFSTLEQLAPKLHCILSTLLVWAPMRRLKERNKPVWVVAFIFYIVIQIAIFPATYTITLLFALFMPMTLSRVMTFLTGIVSLWWSIALIVVIVILDEVIEKGSNHYVVMQNMPGLNATPRTAPHCVCLCEYPLMQGTYFSITLMTLIVTFQSVSVGLRSLKGLRRPTWASLVSVLYALPIEVFPVHWEHERGGPINLRTEGQPVQGEPAFDPIALMDEQPNSYRTRPSLLPRPQEREHWQAPIETVQETTGEVDVGCCGFPRNSQAEEYTDDSDSDTDKEGSTLAMSDNKESYSSLKKPLHGHV
jgi:hypothetical protein